VNIDVLAATEDVERRYYSPARTTFNEYSDEGQTSVAFAFTSHFGIAVPLSVVRIEPSVAVGYFVASSSESDVAG